MLSLIHISVDRRCLRPEDVSDDEKLSRTIKIIAVSKFIKEIVRSYCSYSLILHIDLIN